MGYSSFDTVTHVTRASAPLAAFTPSHVVYQVQAETGMSVFACPRLHATLTASACAAQHERGLVSCIGCSVGKAHSRGRIVNPKETHGGRSLPGSAQQQSCIRCGRNGRDEHSERIIGRLKTVHKCSAFLKGGSRKTTLCVSCFNRNQEGLHGFVNSKGNTSRKHNSAILRDTVISYIVGEAAFEDVAISLRSGVPEIRRLLERAFDGKAKLTAVSFNGVAASLDDTADPLWAANNPRKPKVHVPFAKPTAKPETKLAAIAKQSRRAKLLRAGKSVESQAEYADSLGAMLRDALTERDGSGLRDLAQWLLAGINPGPWRYVAPAAPKRAARVYAVSDGHAEADPLHRLDDDGGVLAYAPVEPSAPVADAIAPAEGAKTVTDDSEWAGVTVRDGRGVEYDIANAAARFEVAPEKIAAQFGIPSNADMVFAGKTLGEWSERTGQTVAALAKRMVETGSPFEGKRAAIQPPPARVHVEASTEAFEAASEPAIEPEEDVVEVAAPVALGNTHSGMTADQFAAHFMHSQRDDAPKGITEADLVLATGCSLTGDYVPAQADEDVADTDTSEPVIEPVAAAPVKPQKALTGKQLRKLEKAQRRAEREAAAPAPERPAIGKSPRAIAVTARALVQVAFELNGYKSA
ncbi:hypothetical protein [Paraburkholderia sp. BCC1876]|uniref:hypothetical protein n=1 Tax=Paraburkholderia sp. BCC1876 TaxID=2676303 RepID=UPI001591641D|nr:hypothetical protein [Paraburkholderia sp. BCC1876]